MHRFGRFGSGHRSSAYANAQKQQSQGPAAPAASGKLVDVYYTANLTFPSSGRQCGPSGTLESEADRPVTDLLETATRPIAHRIWQLQDEPAVR